MINEFYKREDYLDQPIYFHFISIELLSKSHSAALKEIKTQHVPQNESNNISDNHININKTTKECIWIWVGDASFNLLDIHCSFPLFLQSDLPPSACILRGENDYSSELSSKLVWLFKVPIYLSLSLENIEDPTISFIQKILIDSLRNRKEWNKLY